MSGHLSRLQNPHEAITAIDGGITFPESLTALREKYEQDIRTFVEIVRGANSSADVLRAIRAPRIHDAERRMSYLKLFRRCVSTVCDTETTKKVTTVETDRLIRTYGHTFKPIDKLQRELLDLSEDKLSALAVLVGEYDNRGQSGYALAGMFFDWFETTFAGRYVIAGPRGPGPDIELRTIFPDFGSDYPCDMVITPVGRDQRPVCVGFSRYDSTRGGAQSDDRTGGNANKVEKLKAYAAATGRYLNILFLADGPGLLHGDTWREACLLDSDWNDRVRVTTLKLSPIRVTVDWLATGGA